MSRYRLFLQALAFPVLLFGCRFLSINPYANLVHPSNRIITEQRPVGSFTGIDMGTIGRVIINQGEFESLSVKGSDNIVPLVKTEVKNGVLMIGMDKNVDFTGMKPDNLLTFNITIKDLNQLTLSGAGNISVDTLSTQDFIVVMSGAGQVVLNDFSAISLNTQIFGVGNVNISGEVDTANVEITGVGNFNGPKLKIEKAEISISGLGEAEVWVTDTLTGDISGNGTVKYFGSPKIHTTDTGVGGFSSIGDK